MEPYHVSTWEFYSFCQNQKVHVHGYSYRNLDDGLGPIHVSLSRADVNQCMYAPEQNKILASVVCFKNSLSVTQASFFMRRRASVRVGNIVHCCFHYNFPVDDFSYYFLRSKLSHSDFSRYIVFISIHFRYKLCMSKYIIKAIQYLEKLKTTYNLKWRQQLF